jgi:acyl-phosphate glycerol 3-phosphate acyltransferase
VSRLLLLPKLLLLPAAYLYASLNWAILITGWVRGVDIRSLGTHNPGAANVGRNLGRHWGALVYFLDLSKSLLPLAIGGRWLFPGSGPWDYAALALTGIAAIAGHCRPVFFGFRGGGGISTAMGVYLFFVPVEFMASVFLAFGAAAGLKSRVRYFMGQWTPILFVAITPFLTLALNWMRVPLRGRVTLGGHPWWVVAGTFAVSLFVLAMNRSFLARKLDGRDAI